MGNCLVMQEKVIKVMKPDGKVLEYNAPIKVHQVLSDFAGHAISDTLPVVRHLRPNSDMIGGHLYYLLHLPVPPLACEKKRVNFASSEREEAIQGSGVVRIKVVMSKQNLEVMLRNGVVSLDDLVSQLQKKQSTNQNDKFDAAGNRSREGWKPLLESIPEVN
ncbi:Protein of unknown function DUF4228, plant protein [Actinidia chinensis var. chinensis]|uniref:Uncharacterized protein n=1 Tax=Actinidia chinensis var. chinensis TaxID=1590841 RepID=A0A2R6R7R1_ACTCC|nr:Protein of unknown function DUF4228, plant protein [Actinidia chinensis var. chinensis]